MIDFVKLFYKAEKSPWIPITDVWSNRFNVVLHSEGVDIMRVYMYYIISILVSGENKKVVVASPIFENCSILLEEVTYNLKKILKFFPKITIENNQSKVRGIELSNGSSLQICKVHYKSYINNDVDLVILMDLAYAVTYVVETFFKLCVVMQSAKPDGKFIVSSTPNGKNLFYDIFSQSEQGKNIFNPLRLYYWMDPEQRNTKWISDMTNIIGEDEFNRKYNLSFKTKQK